MGFQKVTFWLILPCKMDNFCIIVHFKKHASDAKNSFKNQIFGQKIYNKSDFKKKFHNVSDFNWNFFSTRQTLKQFFIIISDFESAF